MNGKPRLIVVAGPNGSGKTTITDKLLRHEWMGGCIYINPDVIAQEESGNGLMRYVSNTKGLTRHPQYWGRKQVYSR